MPLGSYIRFPNTWVSSLDLCFVLMLCLFITWLDYLEYFLYLVSKSPVHNLHFQNFICFSFVWYNLQGELHSIILLLSKNQGRKKKIRVGNFLEVQWLGLCPSMVGAMGWIPGWGTKIPQATWSDQKNKVYSEVVLHLEVGLERIVIFQCGVLLAKHKEGFLFFHLVQFSFLYFSKGTIFI